MATTRGKSATGCNGAAQKCGQRPAYFPLPGRRGCSTVSPQRDGAASGRQLFFLDLSHPIERVKLSENAFRDVNIAFANELSLIAGQHELDVWRVIELANRHPRVNILRPGPGVGGHCIAVDPWFLAHGAPRAARLIPAARAVDAAKRASVLEQASALCAAGERVICLGLAFKGDVGDLRESPALAIATELARRHPGQVVAVEPHLDTAPAGLDAPLLSLDAALESPGALLVLTDHSVFARLPPAALAGRRIIDTRGIFRRPEETA